MLDIYSAINAGSVGRYNASDANNGGAPGTVKDKVEKQMGGHRQKALALLGGEFTPSQSDYAGGATGGAYRPPGDAPARDPRRLAWAYRTGKMTPEDAALYEKGLADGKIEKPQAKEEPAPVQRPDPLEAYAMTAMGRQRAPVQINAPQLLAPRQPGQQEQAPLFNRWQMYQDKQWPGLAG